MGEDTHPCPQPFLGLAAGKEVVRRGFKIYISVFAGQFPPSAPPHPTPPCSGEAVLATTLAIPECSLSPARKSERSIFLQGSGAKTKSRAWRSAPATLGCQRSTMKTTRGPSSGEPRAYGGGDSRAADIKYLQARALTKYSERQTLRKYVPDTVLLALNHQNKLGDSTISIPILYKVTEAQRLSNLPDVTLLVSARGRTGTQVVQVEVLVLRTTWL